MLSPQVGLTIAPPTRFNILQALSYRWYQKLPKLTKYGPTAIFLNHIGRTHQQIAWHSSDFITQYPHSLQYRMLRAITTDDIEQIKKILKRPDFMIDEPIDKKYGLNALQFASLINQFTIIQILLMNGANINKKDKYGNTALMQAVQNHNLESINSLMKNGCNRYEKNNYGLDALQKAQKKVNQTYLLQFLKNYPENPRRFPKFKIKLQFQKKYNKPFWDYVKNYKIYESKPKVFPFNNFKGTYRIDMTAYQTVNQICQKKKAQIITSKTEKDKKN